MNMVIKQGFRFCATHLLAMGATLVCLMSFAWLIGSNKPSVWFAALTTVVYTWLWYMEGWKFGKIEAKGYDKSIRPNPLRGALAALVPNSVGIVCLALLLCGVDSTGVYKIWYMMFTGLYPHPMAIGWLEMLSTVLFSLLISVIAYAVGGTGFSVMDRRAAHKQKRAQEKKEAAKSRKRR